MPNPSGYCLFSVAICIPLHPAALYRGFQIKIQKILISENTHNTTVHSDHVQAHLILSAPAKIVPPSLLLAI